MARTGFTNAFQDVIDGGILVGIIKGAGGPNMVLNDFESHNHATSIPIKQVVRELVELLGPTLVAAIGGVNETRAVTQWMEDREPQRPQVLRFALQLAGMVVQAGDGTIARAWFQASNPHLNDRSPVMLLRQHPLEEIQAKLMGAARGFASRDDITPPIAPVPPLIENV
jgi:hypothetical protein